MGTGKKEAARKVKQGKVGDGMNNVKVKGENFYRDAKKVKTIKRLTAGKAERDAKGNITKAAIFQSRDIPNARIEPNRKWFTNSRVISQQSLSNFREAVAQQSSDPYSFLLKTNKLPMSLIRDDETKKVNGIKQHKAKIVVETSSFKDTFGPKAQRKRVKMGNSSSFTDLAGESVKMHGTYLDRLEQAKLLSGQLGAGAENADDMIGQATNVNTSDGVLTVARESIFTKGQSRRIWNELYKVIDSSDVVVHVLDARDPLGTRCRAVEKYLKEEAPHKHLVFILNKCDLVPTSVAAAWVRLLSTEYPTLAFHASITNSFGKGSLISLLRQFSILHASRKQISCGFIGYPNTGKSSIINTLRKKVVCKTAPIPGETKVWQYITLTRRIYLIDCPGVVPPNANDSEAEILLRGVVRVENVENPAQYVVHALARCQDRHIERTYGITGWKDADEFLELLARKSGRLLKGGEADHDGVAKMVLTDFLRGRIPWFIAPPAREGEEGKKGDGEEAAGAGKKRKRTVDDGEGGEKLHAVAGLDKIFVKAAENAAADEDEDDEGESDFEGLDDLVVDPAALGDLDGSEVSGDEEEDDDDGANDDDADDDDEDDVDDELPSQNEIDDEAAEEDIEAEGGGASLLSVDSSPAKNDRRARQQLQAEARLEVEQTPAKKRRMRR